VISAAGSLHQVASSGCGMNAAQQRRRQEACEAKISRFDEIGNQNSNSKLKTQNSKLKYKN